MMSTTIKGSLFVNAKQELPTATCCTSLSIPIITLCSHVKREPFFVFLSQFCTAALEHNASAVRELAVRVILSLYQQHRAAILSYLPPNDAAARKNFLFKTLFDGFAKLDGKLVDTQARSVFFSSSSLTKCNISDICMAVCLYSMC